MGSGDLTIMSGAVCTGITEITAAVEAINLPAVTDFLFVTPLDNGQHLVFGVAREA